MCLAKKGRFKPCTVGYKVVRRSNGAYKGELWGEKTMPVGEWLNETDYRERAFRGEKRLFCEVSEVEYRMGWHVFHDLASALRWREIRKNVVVKVEVAEPVATGYQNLGLMSYDGHKTTVAKQIKILEEVQ